MVGRWQAFQSIVKRIPDLNLHLSALKQATWYLNAAGVLVWYDSLAGGKLRHLVFLQPAFLTQLMRTFVHSVDTCSSSSSSSTTITTTTTTATRDGATSLAAADARPVAQRPGSSLAELARSGTDADEAEFLRRIVQQLQFVDVEVLSLRALEDTKWPPTRGWDTCGAQVELCVTMTDKRQSGLQWTHVVELRELLTAMGVHASPAPGLVKRVYRRLRRTRRNRAQRKLQGLRARVQDGAWAECGEPVRIARVLGMWSAYRRFAGAQGWTAGSEASDSVRADATDVPTWFSSRRSPPEELRHECVVGWWVGGCALRWRWC